LRRAVFGAGLTVAAGVTAVAVLAATAGGGAGPAASSNGKTGKTVTGLSARQILLTAAVSAARQPATGRYWRVEDVTGDINVAGPNDHPYTIEQRWAPMATWDARSPRERTWTFPATGYRSVLPTAGAAAPWRADGSHRLPSQGGRQQAWWQTGGAVGYLDNGNLTFTQFQRLPSSPAKLAAVVRTAAEQQVRASAVKSERVSPGPELASDMFNSYDQLLKLDPITPQVRAGVFTDLARLPGVRSIGQVTDPLGRTGYGIALAPGQQTQNGQETDEQVLVIAPGSGLLLADEMVVVARPHGRPAPASGAVPGLKSCPPAYRINKGPGYACLQQVSGQTMLVIPGPVADLAVGQVESYDAVISAGWTDVSPQLPPRDQQFSVTKDGKG
jgi:hypothetical protein